MANNRGVVSDGNCSGNEKVEYDCVNQSVQWWADARGNPVL